MEILKLLSKRLVCGLAALSLGVGCTKEAKIKLPAQENKLVVTSFISPGDTVIMVTVRNAAPKFEWGQWSGSNFTNLRDATVLLSDGTQQVTIPYDTTHGFYYIPSKNFSIVEGKTYVLQVSTPDGRRVSAETTVPSGTPALMQHEVSAPSVAENSFNFNTSVKLADLPDRTYLNLVFDVEASAFPDDPPVNPILYYESRYFYQSDEFEKRSDYQFLLQSELSDMSYYQYVASKVTVLHCDEHFYQYHKTIREAPASSGNPFADPVMVYSNINKGLGCFGSYVKKVYTKRIR